MNWNWYSLRRMRGALILILLGVVFFLQESDWFHWDVWPLFLVGLGVILLAERILPAAPPPPMPNPYAPYPQYPGAYSQPQQPPSPQQSAPPAENPPTPRTGNWS